MHRLITRHASWLVCASLIVIFIIFFQTPRGFVAGTMVSVPSGMSFSEAAQELQRGHIIVSPLILRFAMALSGGAENLKAGDYLFKRSENALSVARRLSQGRYDLTTVRVLLPEGSSSKDMGRILAGSLPRIDAAMFAREVRTYEGYLFPDTYFLLPTATSGDVIAVLRSTFDAKTAEFVATSSEDGPSFADIVTMASLIEEEARTPEDKRIVSGILWKRLREGERLQVDAPFMYLLGKASHELTTEDLELDSPYNTYRYEGLPPAPITNPGLVSLRAAYDPLETPYWFYLSDEEGMIHYAETFEEHLANKQKYISSEG